MPISPVDLLDDLKQIRRGGALNAADIGVRRVGPALTELAGITSDDSNAVVRHKLREWLGEHVEQLPKATRRFVEAALALTPSYEADYLNQRVAFVAREIDRDTRTVMRRMDEAMTLLAELAIPTTRASPASSANDWYVDGLEAVLRLDGAPECFERRRIVATRDGLDELAVSITIPRAEHADAPPEVELAAVFGVRLLTKTRVTASRFQFVLQLPRALSAGESTEYGVIVRLPKGQPMSPHYTFIPERRAERFDVRVCFPPDRPPARVWQVTGAFNRDIDDEAFADDVLVPDAVGEVHANFEELKPGFGYGIQWTDAGA